MLSLTAYKNVGGSDMPVLTHNPRTLAHRLAHRPARMCSLPPLSGPRIVAGMPAPNRNAAWIESINKQLATAPPISEERWRATVELCAGVKPAEHPATPPTGDQDQSPEPASLPD